MIKSIGIQNFKAIGKMANVPFKPITLIFGPNSSGKSSIIQSLLMLKQTLTENRRKVLVTTSKLVDLGGFKELIHNHDTECELAFRFELTDFVDTTIHLRADSYSAPEWWDELSTKLQALVEGNSAYVTIKIAADKESGQPCLTGFAFHVGDDVEPVIEYFLEKGETYLPYANEKHSFWKKFALSFDELIASEYAPGRSQELEAADDEADLLLEKIIENPLKTKEFINAYTAARDKVEEITSREREKGTIIPEDYAATFPFLEIMRNHFLPALICCEGSLLDINDIMDDVRGYDISYFQDPAMYLSQASGCIQYHIENIEHIEPLRTAPKRYYSKKDDADLMQVFDDETIFDYLTDQNNLKKVNDALENIGIDYALELQSFKEVSDDLFSINLLNTRTGVTSPLKDVGFGISQVLPIVISCLSGNNKTFVIEQPELHLHPAAQTELGDLFINSALGENKNGFVIETHSEHLILRLLRRIRETADGEVPEGCTPIKPEDVAVLYVQPGSNGAEVIELPVNEDGQFDRPWPNGFFAERAKELF